MLPGRLLIVRLLRTIHEVCHKATLICSWLMALHKYVLSEWLIPGLGLFRQIKAQKTTEMLGKYIIIHSYHTIKSCRQFSTTRTLIDQSTKWPTELASAAKHTQHMLLFYYHQYYTDCCQTPYMKNKKTSHSGWMAMYKCQWSSLWSDKDSILICITSK